MAEMVQPDPGKRGGDHVGFERAGHRVGRRVTRRLGEHVAAVLPRLTPHESLSWPLRFTRKAETVKGAIAMTRARSDLGVPSATLPAIGTRRDARRRSCLEIRVLPHKAASSPRRMPVVAASNQRVRNQSAATRLEELAHSWLDRTFISRGAVDRGTVASAAGFDRMMRRRTASRKAR